MELGKALNIVWGLANQNVIDKEILIIDLERQKITDTDELQHQITKQKLALNTVEDFITNQFGEES